MIKTYALVTVMLVFTVIWSYLVYASYPTWVATRNSYSTRTMEDGEVIKIPYDGHINSGGDGLYAFILNNMWLYYVMLVITICIMCSLTCGKIHLFREVPKNYVVCAIFTVTHAYMVGALAAQYDIQTVMTAAVLTTGMFFALTSYACFTKTDITYFGGIISSFCMCVLLTYLMGVFMRDVVIWRIALCCILIPLLSLYIIYDTQRIVGKKGRHEECQLDLDDYVIGAILIYSDIICLFWWILQLFGGNN